MCGIWGFFPKDNKGIVASDLGMIEQSMILTSLRGQHSTGVALVCNPATKPKVFKTLGGAAFILNTDAWTKITEVATKSAKVMFGHGRHATKGNITTKNAHPFTHEHITLVHNGTINYGLDDEHKEAETEVDSHALAVAIAKKGLVEALDALYGAYALIVHDSKEGAIYVVRNDERPLHQIEVPGGTLIMSEYSACQYFAVRNSLSNPKIEYFPKHMIFKYDIKTALWTQDKSLQEMREKKYQLTTYNKWGGGQTHGTKWGAGGNNEITTYSTVELHCVKIEPTDESAKTFRYIFMDKDKLEYIGVSSNHQPDREGEMCLTFKHTRIVDKASGSVKRFVKFRELKWVGDEVLVEPTKSDEEDTTTHVITYNKQLLSKRQWAEVIKHNCGICSGPIYETEAEDTIVNGQTVICGDCVKHGKHYAFGFGQ